jgi:RNA polymerase sigma factor (sigma-70 family)
VTKPQLDKWLSSNYVRLMNYLPKKYPKCTSPNQDLSDFYIHIVESERYLSITNIEGYLHSFVFNRHYRYHSSRKSPSILEERKGFQVFITDTLPEPLENNENSETLIEQIDVIIEQLPLDFKILFNLYYVEGKSTREIGKLHGLSHVGIHKQLKKLQELVRCYYNSSSQSPC